MFRWRRLEKGELDHELIWLVVSILAGVIGAAFLRLGLPLPHCTFREWTHHACPGCGATRAATALLRGDVAGAFFFNPLATCAFFAVALFDAYAAAVLALRLPRLRVEAVPARTAKWLRAGAGAALALHWAWLIRAGV